MSRITDYILEPKVVYTEGGFLVRVKVIDDYKYKKYIVSENLHYKTIQGTSFTLTDAEANKQASITELKGNTSQEGTPTPETPVEVKTVSGDNNVVVSNKNKLALNKVEKGRIDNGNVGYQNNTTNLEVTNTDITFTTNANYRGVVSDFIPIEILQTINNYVYLIMDNKKAFLTNGAIQISFYDANKNYISANSGYALNDTTQRYAITNNMKFARIWFCLNQQGTITLEKVSFGYYTDYTEHQGDIYRVDFGGKNLCNFASESNLPLQENITTILDLNTEKTFGSIFVSFELEDAMFTNASSAAIIDYKKADGTHQYRILGTFTNVETGIGMQINTVMNGRYYHQEKNITFKTINIYMGSGYGGFVQGKVKNFQIEESNLLTPYSPYTDNPIELCKIGNYQDKLYYDSGKWYLHKEVGKVVLNGSETWGQNSAQTLTNTSLYFTNIIDDVADISKNTLSNFFEYKQLWNTDVQGVYLYIGGNGLRIRINTSIASSVNSFKTWLSNNNTTVYYVLATPTTEEITDSYLLEQLQALENIELYEDLCYVDWVGSEEPTMSLQYAGTEDLGIKYIITEDGKKIRTDWRKLGRRKNGR